MTIALNPSPWYRALLTYKNTQFQEFGSTLGALAYRWLLTHEQELAGLLGGDSDYVTVVPSKRGKTYENQPLRRALGMVGPMIPRMREAVRCVTPISERMFDYNPDIFETVLDVSGDRVILVEDTWISGATALSAAGALLRDGAASVVITPIAREMKPSFHGKEHPYLQYLGGNYVLDSWPR
ncbi:MAG: phosphoribosyltransferase [Acidobacteriota bacterium]